LTNSIGMKLVLIPPGEFQMGSPEDEKDRYSDEGPQHRVRLTQPFYLGVHEVTQGEYERVTGTNPSHFMTVSGQDPSRFPVEKVSWEDAVEFCRKLSALPAERSAGREYRLPTEAEWEYACRAGTTTPFHFGSVLNGREANCDGNYPYGTSEKGPHLKRTTTVGSYSANGFGLYDMHGNLWEWCSDWYDEKYYANSPVDDPQGPALGSRRVGRGGCWIYDAGVCRSADRYWHSPDYRYGNLGFRLALVPADKSGK
jgi:formylglycine-generating enzyme required for sulfatase activity